MRLPRNRKYRLIVTTGLIVTLIGLSRVAVPVHWFTPQYPWTSRGVRSQLPDVLLIGDSTEMRYATYVLDALDGVANVYSLWEYDSQRLHSLFIGGPLIRPVNASSTHNGLRHLDPKQALPGTGVRAGVWHRAWPVVVVDRRRSPAAQAALRVAEPGFADTSPRGSSSGRSIGSSRVYVCLTHAGVAAIVGSPRGSVGPSGCS